MVKLVASAVFLGVSPSHLSYIAYRIITMAKSDINAWREILARIFEGLTVQYNLSPAWLINPDTRRPLKLDMLFPDIGVAVRFQGLRGKQQRGPSNIQEQIQQRKRDENRDKVCADHGINLASLNLNAQEPSELFNALELTLSRASRRLAKDDTHPEAEIMALRDHLSQVRGRASEIGYKIKENKDLLPYFDLWQDRQYREAVIDETGKPTQTLPPLKKGMLVEHTLFGLGEIQALEPSGDDSVVTIEFIEEGEKTFLASLLAGKIEVA